MEFKLEENTNLNTLADLLDEARSNLIEVLSEIDYITLQVNPILNANYSKCIGCWINREANCQLEMLIAKRKYELAQLKLNCGLNIDDKVISEIENQINNKFVEWKNKIDAMMNEYCSSISLLNNKAEMNDLDAKEFKRLHRILTKRLHPDLAGEEYIELFRAMQTAYKLGDIDSLRSMEIATRHLDQKEDSFHTVDEFNTEILIIESQTTVMKEKLNKLKDEFPYNIKEELNDPKWINSKVSVIKTRITEYEEATKAYEKKYKDILRYKNE